MTPTVWRGIVKVQRQLNEPRDSSALIYSRNNSIHVILPMSSELLQMFGTDLKFYAYAELVGTIIEIKKRVNDRSW